MSLFRQIESVLNKDDVYQQVFGPKAMLKCHLSRFENSSAFLESMFIIKSAFLESRFFLPLSKELQIRLYVVEPQMVDGIGSRTIRGRMLTFTLHLGI